MTLKEAAAEFLIQARIAVAGVSRSHGQAANTIYRKLRSLGYQVYAVNPNAEQVEGDRCYPRLADIDGGVDAVVIATHPDVTPRVARECVALGIPRVWMHRSFGTGSVSDEAVQVCVDGGVSVIPGGCPMMFLESTDIPHACMRWILGHTGGLPDVDAWAPGAAPAEPSPGPTPLPRPPRVSTPPPHGSPA
jgi:predicted CoA-binding protein